jgi:hypothetical protein
MTAGFFLLSQGLQAFAYSALSSLFLLRFCEFWFKITDKITNGSREIHADTSTPQNFLFILYFPLDFTPILAHNKHVNKRGAQPRRKEK